MSKKQNTFLCDKCRRELSYQPKYAGSTVACPYCGYVFTMAERGKKMDNQTAVTPVAVKANNPTEKSSGVGEIPAAKKQPKSPAGNLQAGADKPPGMGKNPEVSSAVPKIGPAAGSIPSKAVPFIIYPPTRPRMLSFLVYLALVLVAVLLAGMILVSAVGTARIQGNIPYIHQFDGYKLDLQKPDASWVNPMFYIGYLVVLFIVLAGMLRGHRWVRVVYLLMFLVLAGWVAGQKIIAARGSEPPLVQFIMPFDLIKAAGLGYMFVLLLYLQFRRVKNWFD